MRYLLLLRRVRRGRHRPLPLLHLLHLLVTHRSCLQLHRRRRVVLDGHGRDVGRVVLVAEVGLLDLGDGRALSAGPLCLECSAGGGGSAAHRVAGGQEGVELQDEARVPVEQLRPAGPTASQATRRWGR